jgi:hypothetical protein
MDLESSELFSRGGTAMIAQKYPNLNQAFEIKILAFLHLNYYNEPRTRQLAISQASLSITALPLLL